MSETSAFIHRHESVKIEDLRAFLAKHIARYKGFNFANPYTQIEVVIKGNTAQVLINQVIPQ